MIPHCWGEWIAFRDDMDELEASLSIDHPELDWTDAMRPFKDEADTAIRKLTTVSRLSQGDFQRRHTRPRARAVALLNKVIASAFGADEIVGHAEWLGSGHGSAPSTTVGM